MAGGEIASISKSLVFVLGAGASVPYGFPSGPKLVRMLSDIRGDQREFRHLSAPAYRSFQEEMEKAQAAILDSKLYSIDEFLRCRPAFGRWGKAAVAKLILAHERISKSNRLVAEDAHDWMRILWNHLKARPDVFVKHRVAFITLNYDRLLEHYLVRAMAESFGISNATAWESISQLPFLHLHGTVGDYAPDERSTNDVPFGNDLAWPQLLEAGSLKFRFWWEENDGASLTKQATDLLSAAEYVICLGIGQASSLLGPFRGSMKNSENRRFVTAYGLENMEAYSLQRVFGVNSTADKSVDGAMLLRRFPWHAVR